MTIDSTPKIERMLELKELLRLLHDSSAIDHVAKGVYNENEVRIVGSWLAAYAANQSSVIAGICSELDRPEYFQQKNDLQPPCFIIYSNGRLTIRLVVWLPLPKRLGKTPFSYEEPHDHNFDFWTVNFFGSGYRTRLYDYNYDSVIGISNESVTLDYCGERILSPGKVMFYTRSKDVHIQYPPDELSASLNLIVQPDKTSRQYEFQFGISNQSDHIEARIKKGRFERYNAQESLFHGLVTFGNAKSRQLVLDVALHSRKDEIRAIAFEASLKYAGQSHETGYANLLATMARHDPSAYVRAKVANRIRTLPGLGPNFATAQSGDTLSMSTSGEIP